MNWLFGMVARVVGFAFLLYGNRFKDWNLLRQAGFYVPKSHGELFTTYGTMLFRILPAWFCFILVITFFA